LQQICRRICQPKLPWAEIPRNQFNRGPAILIVIIAVVIDPGNSSLKSGLVLGDEDDIIRVTKTGSVARRDLFDCGVVIDWDNLEKIWHHIF